MKGRKKQVLSEQKKSKVSPKPAQKKKKPNKKAQKGG